MSVRPVLQPGRIHGLFVGIDAYERMSGLLQLRGCANDAHALAGVFQRITGSSPWLVTNAEATRRAILGGLEQMISSADPGDLLLFFCASHGQVAYNDFYLLPADAEDGHVLSTGFPFSVLAAALGTLDRVRTLLVIDACQSGAIGFDISDYRQGSESSVLLSAAPLEKSWEYRVPETGIVHGAFTYSIIEALNAAAAGENKGRLIDVFEATYLGTKARSQDRQHPVLIGTLDYGLKIA